MSTGATPLIDEHVVRQTDDGPVLLGGRCRSCDTTTFPPQGSCPRCTGEDVATVELPRTGTLWSWTVQRFAPRPPYLDADDFAEYGVGYVDLGGQVLVEARLTTADAEQLRIGMPVRLELVELGDDTEERAVPAFAPEQP